MSNLPILSSDKLISCFDLFNIPNFICMYASDEVLDVKCKHQGI